MEPTLLAGDRVSVQPASEFHRGDIVVFHATLDGTDVTLIKRLVGLPSDHLKFSDKILILNSRSVSEKYVVHRGPDNLGDEFYFFRNFPAGAGKLPATMPISASGREMLQKYVHDGELVVPPGQYFLLGDNRDYSMDSRMQGLIPASAIIGVAREIVSSEDPRTERPRPGRTHIPIDRVTFQ